MGNVSVHPVGCLGEESARGRKVGAPFNGKRDGYGRGLKPILVILLCP